MVSNTNNNSAEAPISFAGKLVWNMNDFYQQSSDRRNNNNTAKICKWGEVVSVFTTSGVRNSPMIATIQGFYELHNNSGPPQPMPPSLRARKVILSKSRTIGIIIGANARLSENNMDNNNNNAQPQMGCCQVLFPNGMVSGPSSSQSLKGARAILYD
jgi:hypothetical protein